ncbi:MAG: DEAD/DEAH box helicase [Phycisphaerales bacterium JB039]
MTTMTTDRPQDRSAEEKQERVRLADLPDATRTGDAGPNDAGGGESEAPKKKRRRRRRRGGAKPEATGTPETGADGAEQGAAAGDPARAPGEEGDGPRKRRRRRRRGRGEGAGPVASTSDTDADTSEDVEADAEARPARRSSPIDPEAAKEIFSQVEGFADLGLSEAALRGVADAGFERPTVIQAKLIPPAMRGADILGQAKTGTGKTAAFVLPLLSLVEKGKPFQALILAPTRELAIQIDAEIRTLGKHTGVRSVPIYGGQRIPAQIEKLEKGPEIVVGAPGRVMDMHRRGHIDFSGMKFVVLDEVDRMLDIGFREDIRWILSRCPKKRQTMFVSATISEDIDRLARSFMTDPEKIVTSAGSLTVSLVTQRYLAVQSWDKKRLLRHLLTHEEPALTLIFCRLKRTVDELARYLTEKGIESHAIHGDMPQSKRNSVMRRLRGGELSVLIASDLASRGIDVEGISHVINYDLPEDIELYIHRIGRTARAGRGGIAWSLVTPEQGQLLTDIELRINAEIPKMEYPDFQPGPAPADAAARIEAEKRRVEQLRSQNRFKPMSTTPEIKDAADEKKFPGGIVPTKTPPRTLGGRVRARRR